MLNEAAPFFFRIVHDTFFEATILSIARLVAPEESCGQPNLTIRRLPDLVTEQELKIQVAALVVAAQKSAEFTRDWRNRRLAHLDLALSLQGSAIQPLAPVSRVQVEGAFSALEALLNHIELAYCGAQTAYAFCHVPGDAEQLLYFIQSSLLRERDRHASWDRLESHPDDINPPPDV